MSAVQEVERDFAVPVVSVATLDDLMSFLGDRSDFREHAAAVARYRLEDGGESAR
jgi:orotate phosphoribosyltransferase